MNHAKAEATRESQMKSYEIKAKIGGQETILIIEAIDAAEAMHKAIIHANRQGHDLGEIIYIHKAA